MTSTGWDSPIVADAEPEFVPSPSAFMNCPACGAFYRAAAPHDCETFLRYRGRLRVRIDGTRLDDEREIEIELAERRARGALRRI